uniref:Uncharacterized protein n=1 Tax=Sphaerodactylus townsendi TaxID=933632 RepID=A0ACB8FT34_9SAUR
MMLLARDVSQHPSDLKRFLAVLLALLLMVLLTSGQKPCLKESITIVEQVTQLLGNSSDAELYTPEDFTVRIFHRYYIMEACYASHLECFREELKVVREEEARHEAIVSKLIHLLAKAKPRKKSCPNPDAQCQPCECHPEQPVPRFLQKLQEMLQWSCRTQTVPCVAKQRETCWPPQ